MQANTPDSTLQWPKWLLEGSESIRRSTNSLNDLMASIEGHCQTRFEYESLPSRVIRELTKRIGEQIGLVESDGTYRASKACQPKLTPNDLRVLTHWIGQSVRMLRAFQKSTEIRVLTYWRGATSALNSDGLLVAITSYRAILESVACFNWSIRRIHSEMARSSVADSANQDAMKLITTVHEELYRTFLGTRANLAKLSEAENLESLKKDDLAYQEVASFENQKAHNPLTQIATLAKDVPVAETLYALLCEFVHPNHLSNLAICEGAWAFEDRYGISWGARMIGLGTPRALVDISYGIKPLEFIFEGLVAALKFWEILLREADSTFVKLGERIRPIVRARLEQFPDLFHSNEKCPCGMGGRKVRECCGKPSAAKRGAF